MPYSSYLLANGPSIPIGTDAFISSIAPFYRIPVTSGYLKCRSMRRPRGMREAPLTWLLYTILSPSTTVTPHTGHLTTPEHSSTPGCPCRSVVFDSVIDAVTAWRIEGGKGVHLSLKPTPWAILVWRASSRSCSWLAGSFTPRAALREAHGRSQCLANGPVSDEACKRGRRRRGVPLGRHVKSL